jgi:transposase
MKSKHTSDGRKLDHATLQAMRQQAVKAIREGQDVASVAAAYGVNERSVYRWLADFANGGQNALLAKPIPGRPPKVSAEEMQWLAQAVRDHSPLQFKFEFGLWTLSGTTWAPQGCTPVVEATGKRFSPNMISAVVDGGQNPHFPGGVR